MRESHVVFLSQSDLISFPQQRSTAGAARLELAAAICHSVSQNDGALAASEQIRGTVKQDPQIVFLEGKNPFIRRWKSNLLEPYLN